MTLIEKTKSLLNEGKTREARETLREILEGLKKEGREANGEIELLHAQILAAEAITP